MTTSSNKDKGEAKKDWKQIEVCESFYVDGIMDTPITIKGWKWNWKFPFLHRTTATYTMMEWQKLLNRALNQRINDMLKIK